MLFNLGRVITFRRQRLANLLGYFPIGLAFGVLAQQAGLHPFEIGLMSLLVFAGSSQFIAVSMLGGGGFGGYLFFSIAARTAPWFAEWLDLIPVAILSALVFPELVTGGSPRFLNILQPQFVVAVPTFLFALKSRSLGGTIVTGMLLFWLAGKLM